jgi:hypothetical protein
LPTILVSSVTQPRIATIGFKTAATGAIGQKEFSLVKPIDVSHFLVVMGCVNNADSFSKAIAFRLPPSVLCFFGRGQGGVGFLDSSNNYYLHNPPIISNKMVLLVPTSRHPESSPPRCRRLAVQRTELPPIIYRELPATIIEPSTMIRSLQRAVRANIFSINNIIAVGGRSASPLLHTFNPFF